METLQRIPLALRPALRHTSKLPTAVAKSQAPSRAFSAAFATRRNPLPPLRRSPFSSPTAYLAARTNTTSARAPHPLTDRGETPNVEATKRDVPSYEITFTCKPCKTRSRHNISKHGYHHGTVLITCPECKNRHVISDHLKVFSDKSMTIERLLAEKGEAIKKGTLSPDGGVEFWDDGTDTPRGRPHEENAEAETQASVEAPKSDEKKE